MLLSMTCRSANKGAMASCSVGALVPAGVKKILTSVGEIASCSLWSMALVRAECKAG